MAGNSQITVDAFLNYHSDRPVPPNKSAFWNGLRSYVGEYYLAQQPHRMGGQHFHATSKCIPCHAGSKQYRSLLPLAWALYGDHNDQDKEVIRGLYVAHAKSPPPAPRTEPLALTVAEADGLIHEITSRVLDTGSPGGSKPDTPNSFGGGAPLPEVLYILSASRPLTLCGSEPTNFNFSVGLIKVAQKIGMPGSYQLADWMPRTLARSERGDFSFKSDPGTVYAIADRGKVGLSSFIYTGHEIFLEYTTGSRDVKGPRAGRAHLTRQGGDSRTLRFNGTYWVNVYGKGHAQIINSPDAFGGEVCFVLIDERRYDLSANDDEMFRELMHSFGDDHIFKLHSWHGHRYVRQ